MASYDLKCFSKEFDFLSKITHPNVVKVFDLKEDDKAVYLIMEYLNGQNLALELEIAFAESEGAGLDEEHAKEIFLK